MIKQIIIASPYLSDRQLAQQIGVDHKTIGVRRQELEACGEIPHVDFSIDSLGRKQPRNHQLAVCSTELSKQISPNNLYNMPCEKGIELLSLNGLKVDCLITSPPYNVALSYKDYQDNKSHADYIKWLKSIFDKCQNIMTIGGTVAINIGDGRNGQISTHSDIIQFMTKELDYVMVSTIIWEKSHVHNRRSWGSWLSPSCPSFPTPFEYILLFRYKDRHYKKSNGVVTVTSAEFIENSLAGWKIKPETGLNKLHPAPFPEELPRRIIQQMTYEGDLVLDIFSGSGTTALAAKKLNRRYIGFGMTPEYHDTAMHRLEETGAKAA